MNNTSLIYFIIAFVVLIAFIYTLSKTKRTKKSLTQDHEDNGLSNMKSANKITSKNTKKKSNILDQKSSPLLKEKNNLWATSISYDEDIISLSQEKYNNFELEEKDEINIKILLVDDSLVVRKYIGDLLRKKEYDVVIKNDGVEAIEYLNGNVDRPNLIISDIEMPNMNGFELIENIRNNSIYAHIPILVISAHAQNHLKLMEDENIQGFIKKPFEDDDLLNQINYLIRN